MVLLRLVVEPPITARPSGCSFSLFELGCAPAIRIQFRGDHPPCQGVYHSVSLSLIFRDLNESLLSYLAMPQNRCPCLSDKLLPAY
jgi:hypothetical protein